MKKLNEFLKDNKGLAGEPNDFEFQSNETISITVVVLKIGEKKTLFAHLDEKFVIDNDSILEISESEKVIPNPYGFGKICDLIISSDTEIATHNTILGKDLVSLRPYPLQRPSRIPFGKGTGGSLSENERLWFTNKGINIPEPKLSNKVLTNTYTDTQSPSTSCPTTTNTATDQYVDDNHSDDNHNDDWASDDSNVDDYNSNSW